jgi:hypothetical protein
MNNILTPKYLLKYRGLFKVYCYECTLVNDDNTGIDYINLKLYGEGRIVKNKFYHAYTQVEFNNVSNSNVTDLSTTSWVRFDIATLKTKYGYMCCTHTTGISDKFTIPNTILVINPMIDFSKIESVVGSLNKLYLELFYELDIFKDMQVTNYDSFNITLETFKAIREV